jgi:hypothetical protein
MNEQVPVGEIPEEYFIAFADTLGTEVEVGVLFNPSEVNYMRIGAGDETIWVGALLTHADAVALRDWLNRYVLDDL